jgi:hypothetical protein
MQELVSPHCYQYAQSYTKNTAANVLETALDLANCNVHLFMPIKELMEGQKFEHHTCRSNNVYLRLAKNSKGL